MNNNFVDCDARKFKGQFLLTLDKDLANESWKLTTYGDWKLFTSDLAVVDVYDQESVWLGWCIGHPIVNGILEPGKIILHKSANDADPYEDFYNCASGKWILILVGEEINNLYLDSYGSLAAVYSADAKTVASTPTLIGSDADWDRVLMRELNFPTKLEWLPGGLTFKKNVFRLLPNHCLHLNQWGVKRHWPNRHTDLSIKDNTTSSVREIINTVTDSIQAIAKKHPLCLTLTSGRDSRAVLACARQRLDGTKVFTFAYRKETLEMYIASRIAKQQNLNYQFLYVQAASSDELENWLRITGFSVSGDIWKIHKTLECLDANRVLLPGLSAELHKGIKWEVDDHANTSLSIQQLLKRWKIPNHPSIYKAIENWLSEVKSLNTLQMLDLFHVEQRLGCWAAPAYYGNTTAKFEVAVFNARKIMQDMMCLPVEYRRRKQFSIDLCKATWPELLQFPFNEYPGLYGYFRSKAKKLKQMYLRIG